MKIIVLLVCLIIGVTMGGRLERASGGKDIKIEEAPFFVSIRRTGRHVCSGAFISMKHVLTAANCVLDKSYRNFNGITVVSGTDKKRRKHVGHGIQKISPHEGYLEGLFWCNIAVITLSAHVKWNNKRQAIELPDAEPPHDTYATLVTMECLNTHSGTTSLKALSVKIENPEPAAEIPRNLDPTFYGRVQNTDPTFYGRVQNTDGRVQNTDTTGPSKRGRISMTDHGAPLVHEGRIVGIVATTSPTNPYTSFFVNVFACETFIKEAMGQIASSSSELTSETSSPAKRRRLNP